MAGKTKLGVLGGTVLQETDAFDEFRKGKVSTDYGVCSVLEGENIIFVPRHGMRERKPPHKINHHANITALKKAGVKYVVGVCSVGSLKREFHPGMILVPEDYVGFWVTPTFFDNKVKHVTPALDYNLRQTIVACAEKIGLDVFDGGVYVQTIGPRLETKAEVSFLATLGDVVGMTMASEATLAQEAGLTYAVVCSVDNFAHGVIEEELDFTKVIRESKEKSKKILDLIDAVAEELRNEHPH